MRGMWGAAALLIAAPPALGQARHFRAHLAVPLRPESRALLRSAGVDVLDPLGGRWFNVSVAPGDPGTVRSALIDALQPIEPRAKIHAILRDGFRPEWSGSALLVLFHRDVAPEAALAAAARSGAMVRAQLATVNALLVDLDPA